MRVRTRFAPSPTGFMHIGNLRTALYAYLYAKHNNGDFILRIEDTDRERYVEGAIDVIYSTLKKSGIEHDEGPDKDGGVGPYIQSERKDLYRKYAEELVARGGAYYCFCDKERLAGLTDDKGVRKYDKHCLHLSKEEVAAKLAAGVPYVIRQNIPEEGITEYEDMVYGTIRVPCADMEDEVLLKSDGMPTYNFANVVDDHLMKISHVIRGNEYLSSTPKYNLMYDAFGWERPRYMHLPPIMKDAQRKLSKRYGDANFEDFIAKGYLPEAIINYIALLGWSPKGNDEKLSLQTLIDMFDEPGVNKSPSIFDETKMRWLNGLYIKEMPEAEFLKAATPWFEKSAAKGYDYALLAKLLQGRIETFGDIEEKVSFIGEYGSVNPELYFHKKLKTDATVAKELLPYAVDVLQNAPFDNASLFEAFGVMCEEKGIKKGQLLFVLRAAITAVASTPGGATEMAVLFGREETVRRLEEAMKQL